MNVKYKKLFIIYYVKRAKAALIFDHNDHARNH